MARMIHPPQVRPEEPIAVTPHDGICGGESQQWLSYPTNPHVRFDERGRETERCRMAPSHRARPRLYKLLKGRPKFRCQPARGAKTSLLASAHREDVQS